jgi:hypothetical protein
MKYKFYINKINKKIAFFSEKKSDVDNKIFDEIEMDIGKEEFDKIFSSTEVFIINKKFNFINNNNNEEKNKKIKLLKDYVSSGDIQQNIKKSLLDIINFL